MTLILRQLIDCWGAPTGAEIDPEQRLGPICTDSRCLRRGDLFVPLVGERFDGHAYLSQLPQKGAQAAFVAKSWPGKVPDGLLHWRVDDTLAAYQQLGLLHRRTLSQPVVAVTGSAGKTTTRELIRAALQPLGPVLASEGNNNNDIGVPLTILQASPEQRALVLEMGMRGLGEIQRLSQCSEPDLAVITNIGTAHIGRLGSREAIARAKCEITSGLKTDGLVVIPAGDPLLDALLADVWGGRVLRVRLDDDPDTAADRVGRIEQGDLLIDGDRLALPLAGRHNARNFLLALAVAEQLGVTKDRLRSLQVQLPGGRNRRLQRAGVTILDETYNASPEAVLAALELLAQQAGRRFAVLGTMLELGDRSLELHRQVAQRAADLRLDGLVIVDAGAEGVAMEAAASSLGRLARVASAKDAAAALLPWLSPGDVVLLKASRGVALERMIADLPGT